MKKINLKLIGNQRGNALPFVIIIGLVLMVLVGSLASVAVGGITRTQYSVENRQAYIDAKSVTEYGKVLIDQEIVDYQQLVEAEIQKQKEDDTYVPRDPYESRAIGDVFFYIDIIDERSNSSEALTFVAASSPSVNTRGVFKLKNIETAEPGDSENGTLTTTYTLAVETMNLRRKLNYETSFGYQLVTKTTTGTGATLPVPTPGLPSPITTSGYVGYDKNKGAIYIKTGDNGGIGNCWIDGNGWLQINYNSQYNPSGDKQYKTLEISAFNYFTSVKTLEVVTNRILVSGPMPSRPITGVVKPTYIFGKYNEIWGKKMNSKFTTDLLYFNSGYAPDGTAYASNNILHAKDIVIIGNLELRDLSSLDIKCDNLWITGNLILDSSNIINGSNEGISARNIIIGSDFVLNNVITNGLTISELSGLGIDCDNIWINNNLTTKPGTIDGTPVTITTPDTVNRDQGSYY